MKSLFKLIILILFVGGWGLAAGAVHVICTRKADGSGTRVILVPKDRIRYQDTYADVRAWTLNDVAAHADLTRRLIDTGKAAAFAHIIGGGDDEKVIAALNDTLENGPPATAPGVEPKLDSSTPIERSPGERTPVDPSRRST